jgi:serine/threonine protein kinase
MYRIGKIIGRGSFGKVSVGLHRLTKRLVAIKSINKNRLAIHGIAA